MTRKGNITVDSGAEESVWPVEWENGEKLEAPEKRLKFAAANGNGMTHYGQKTLSFGTKGTQKRKAMRFQVTDVKKPLASVARIIDEGSRVVFGPGAGGCFIENLRTGEKIPMTRERGSFVLEGDFDTDVGGLA